MSFYNIDAIKSVPWLNQNQIDINLTKDEIIESIKESYLAKAEQKTFCIRNRTVEQLESCPLKNLENILQASEEDLMDDCLAQATLAKYWQRDTLQLKVKSVFQRIFVAIVNFFKNLLDTFVISFGYHDVGIGEATPSQWEASEILRLYLEILLIPSALFLIVAQFVESPTIAIIITAAICLTLFIAFVTYVNYFKPCPDKLEGWVEITNEAKKGVFEKLLGRDQELDEMISCLERRKGVILTGNTGVGKTKLIYGLAERIGRGDVPDELKNKKIFVINTARISHRFSSHDISNIEETLKGFENDAILFFDEIHSAFKDKKNPLAESIKTLVERFPFTIAATTEDEYERYGIGMNRAFVRRFQNLHVEQMSKEQIEIVLNQHLQNKNPSIQNEPGIISYLIDRVDELAVKNSETYLSVVNEAIQKVNCDVRNILKNKIAESKSRIEYLAANYFRGNVESRLKETAREIAEEETDQKNLTGQLERQNNLVEEVTQLQTLWSQVKGEMLELSLRIKNNPSTEYLKQWAIKRDFILPALEKVIDIYHERLGEFGIKTRIDQEMIDEIVEDLINRQPNVDLEPNVDFEHSIDLSFN